MPDLGYPFRQARNYSVGRQGYSPIWVVRHCTADDYEDDYARKLGNYFATTSTSVSTHYGVDGTTPWQYVLHKDTAYGARNPANLRGIHIEYCGLVTYNREKWRSLDAMLRHGAKLEARLYRTLGIPHRRLTISQLTARVAGYTTHNDVRIAFGGTHTDPGPGFPHDVLDAYIRAELAGSPKPPTPEEDDMPKFDDRFTLKYLDPDTGATEEVGVDYGTLLSLEYQQRQTVMKQNDRIITLLTEDATRESNEAAAANALLTKLAANSEPPPAE